MKDFIAELGYILAWGIGIPSQALEENRTGYYVIGMFFINICEILVAITIIMVVVLFIYLLKSKKIRKESH